MGEVSAFSEEQKGPCRRVRIVISEATKQVLSMRNIEPSSLFSLSPLGGDLVLLLQKLLVYVAVVDQAHRIPRPISTRF
jgi:hypothetical protein